MPKTIRTPPARGLFPNAAAANRPIFYDNAGRARSVSEVYSVLTTRYASAANSQATRTAMAAVGDAAPARVALASASAPQPAMTIDNAAYLSSFPDSRAVTPVKASRRPTARPPRCRSGADLPLAVPGRRTVAAGLAGGSGIVGQFFVADFVGHDRKPDRLAPDPRRPKCVHRAGSISSAIASARSAKAFSSESLPRT